MDEVNLDELTVAITAANGSGAALRMLYEDLVGTVGRDHASRLWWSVFAAGDATET